MSEFKPSEMVSKLIMLYTFDKMDIALTASSILEIVSVKNTWLSYMDAKICIAELEEINFLTSFGEGEDEKFSLTHDGRSCLSYYFQRIPDSIRKQITDFAKKNRTTLKREQEYIADFVKVDDNAYLVNFKIKDPQSHDAALEINLKVYSRKEAIDYTKKWKQKAPEIYEVLISLLANK
jgi:hypothetical protein